MSTNSSCPVCERGGIPANSERCPQCDADLTCFQALDALSGANVVDQAAFKKTAERNSSGNRRAVPALLLILLVVALLFFFFFLHMRNRFQELDQRVAALNADIHTADRRHNRSTAVFGLNLDTPFKETPDGNQTDGKGNKEGKVTVYMVTVEEWPAPVTTKTEQFASVAEIVAEATTEAVAASAAHQRKNIKNGKKQTGAVGAEQPEQPKQPDYPEDNKHSDQLSKEAVPTIKPKKIKRAVRESAPEEPPQATVVREVREITETTGQGTGNLPTALKVIPVKKWSEKTSLYLTKNTDTVWGISEHFYGNGKYYPVIIEQNPHLVTGNIHNDEIIRLLIDREVLIDLYKNRTEWRDGLLLWKHKVRTGETRKSISARFFPSGYSGRVFYSQNPYISQGNTVSIILP